MAKLQTIEGMVMNLSNIINESMPVYTEDGTQVAVKSSLGLGKGQKVTMLVSKEDWEAIKNQPANTEDMEYDVATAESIIKDWADRGAEIYWKTAADFNKEARDLENHRFRKDPELSAEFDAGISNARDNARATMKNNMRAVESMNKTFKEYLLEFDRSDIALQQQHGAMPVAAQKQQQQPQGNNFKQQMAKSPQKGDVIQNSAGKNFIVQGGSMEGIVVVQLGTNKKITIPHGKQFKFMGDSPSSGKPVFQIIQ